jgi:hypothetical protein
MRRLTRQRPPACTKEFTSHLTTTTGSPPGVASGGRSSTACALGTRTTTRAVPPGSAGLARGNRVENSKTPEPGKAGRKTDCSGQRGKPRLEETSRRLLPWVQAQGNPELSQVCDEVVVHLQSLYRCAPAGRKPDETHSVCTPGKVSPPMLPAWMKYTHPPSHQGITGLDTPPFIAVTGTATQTYIG